MKTLNKENFTDAVTGNSLVFFHRLKGCANCDKMLPLFESFSKDGVQVFDVDVDVEKELTGQYAPNKQWQLPLTVYFENGKVVNTRTGIVDPLDCTKTLQNISDTELQGTLIDLELERATQKKKMFEMDMAYVALNNEITRRLNKTPEVTATPKPKVDLLGFPEGQSPEGGGCEGCGDSQQ